MGEAGLTCYTPRRICHWHQCPLSTRRFYGARPGLQPIVSLLNRETQFSTAKYRQRRNYLSKFRKNVWMNWIGAARG